jgi:O-antigen/teichoic acid export membrane protein
MQGTPWQRLLKSIGANAFGQIMTVIVQIISVPLLIHFWGVKLYGDWLILTAIPTYFTLCDLGFGSAAANEMTMQVAQGDRKAALSIFQSVWLLTSLIALGIIVIALACIWTMPTSDWLNLSTMNTQQANIIILLMVTVVFISQQTVLLVSGFQSEGCYAQGFFYFSLIRLLEFSAVSIVVILGAEPELAALTTCLAWGGGTLGMAFRLRKQAPWLSYGHHYAKSEQIRRLFRPAIAFMGFPLGYALSIQGMTIVIGTILGSTAVVVFSTHRTLSRLAWQVLQMITNSLRPELSMAFGAGDIQLARTLHRRACQVAVWLSAVVVMGLLLWGEWIINVWTRGKVMFDAPLLHIMLIVIIVNSFWYTSQAVPISINRHQQLALRYVVSTMLALGFAIVTIPLWGLRGSALSLLSIDILMAIYVVSVSISLVQDSLSEFLKTVSIPPIDVKSLLAHLKR